MTQQMKTTALTIAVACIVFSLPQKGVAQDAKIAIVDTQELTLTSDEGKVVNDKLQKRLDVIRVEMDKLRKDIGDKETNLQTRDRLLSSAAKAAAAREIDDDKKKFERKAEDYEKEMNEMQAALISPIADKVREVLRTYINEKGFTLVIDVASENQNLVWANSNNNITKDVMVRLNDAYKRSGGAAPAAAPAAAPSATPKPPSTTAPASTTPPQPRPATPPTTPAAPPQK
jgi:Skp family chaperone for outer membrane proteins